MKTIRRIFNKLAETDYVRNAIEEQADLSAFKQHPTPRIILGTAAIAFSYVIGWPAVSLLGTLAVYFKKPLLVVIGGPLTYGLSHLVFLLGMYLAGARYTKIFMRWATRMAMEKLQRQAWLRRID
jgi:uncharacterized membrane protein AbrB (regulator of aidB expression)